MEAMLGHRFGSDTLSCAGQEEDDGDGECAEQRSGVRPPPRPKTVAFTGSVEPDL